MKSPKENHENIGEMLEIRYYLGPDQYKAVKRDMGQEKNSIRQQRAF